ncbi:uncharacterized protein L201_000753 [Kwoniella dendrophila CBS 6074]|uniref:Uncharacterized protein n=1 Tax=Kwoniella dendrophila CBS 6074 TaxID=1295534 RepID=A0AAX4JKI3_9TREE
MASAKASSSLSKPPKVKSTKKAKSSSTDKLSKPISAEEVPSDIDSDNLDESNNQNEDNDNDSSSSSGSSSSDVDSDDNLEDITPRKSSKQKTNIPERRGGSLKKYEPPIGMAELKVSSSFTSSPFEWDALASKPGVELWAIRVPKDLKASRLSSLQISVPSSSSSSSTSSLSSSITGTLKTKSTEYNLHTVGTDLHTKQIITSEGRLPQQGPGVAVDSMRMEIDGGNNNSIEEREMKVEGGEEMDGLRLLLPKIKQGGKLFVSSKPITRKLILTPTNSIQQQTSTTTNEDLPALPSFLSEPSTTSSVIKQSTELPPKREQPLHLLKFRNLAYGYSTPGPSSTSITTAVVGSKSMDIDNDEITSSNSINNLNVQEDETKKKEKKEKKRKSESKDKDSPKKKSKKSKD